MARRQDNGTTTLLELKGYKVGEGWGGEEKVVVKTEVKGRIKCPHCGSSKLYGHGMCQPRETLHTWSNGRGVYLESHRGRWKCCDCKRTFAEGRDLVRSRSRLTRQAEAEALWQLKDRNFSLRHQELVHTVTEVKQRKIVGMLRDDRIATLKEFLGKIPKEKGREVCIDMKEGLREAAEAVFPLARVVSTRSM
jgi:transposase